jgi:colanic acid/amylovoran biosynthesis glycosyltransferase
VISTLHSGIPELVQHGQSGFLVREWEVEQLAAALAEVASSFDSWSELGRAGRAIVESEYDVNRLNDALSTLLYDTVALQR